MLDTLLEERVNKAGLRKGLSARHLRKILRLLISLGTIPKMLQMIETTGNSHCPMCSAQDLIMIAYQSKFIYGDQTQ